MEPTVEVTQADREALESVDDALGFLMYDERDILLQTLARHAQAERDKERDAVVAWLRGDCTHGWGEGSRCEIYTIERLTEAIAANQHRSSEHV